MFVIPKDNPNISFLLGLPWLCNVNVQLFIQKKEVHISNIKKREAIFQIPCSIIFSEDTRFDTNDKNKIIADESLKEEDMNISNKYSLYDKLDKKLLDHDF